MIFITHHIRNENEDSTENLRGFGFFVLSEATTRFWLLMEKQGQFSDSFFGLVERSESGEEASLDGALGNLV